MIFNSIEETIGRTPIVKLGALAPNLFCKVEYFNPLSSVKDRVAKALVDDAISKNLINKDSKIIEATSGNTGVGLAFIGATKRIPVTLIMPDTASIERVKICKHLGANVIQVAGGMKGAIAKKEEMMSADKNFVGLDQFSNPMNPTIHYLTTGQEIVEDFCQNKLSLDYYVAGVGTGGTFSGVSKCLKEHFQEVKTIAVLPEAAPHKIQGIGAGFTPDNFNTQIVDELIKVKDEDAFAMMKKLAVETGIVGGISAGANLKAALEIAMRPENKDKNVLCIIPDSAERYLSIL